MTQLNIKNLDQIKSVNIDCEDLTFCCGLGYREKHFITAYKDVN